MSDLWRLKNELSEAIHGNLRPDEIDEAHVVLEELVARLEAAETLKEEVAHILDARDFAMSQGRFFAPDLHELAAAFERLQETGQ